MATTYTTNYNLGKQTDHTDKFDMNVITDNMDIIDEQMKENADDVVAIKQSEYAISAAANDDLDNYYISAETLNVRPVKRWVCSSAEIAASLSNLPPDWPVSYTDIEIEYHLVSETGRGYQIVTGGSSSGMKRCIRWRGALGEWVDWYDVGLEAITTA